MFFVTFWKWLLGLFHSKIETYTVTPFIVDKKYIVIREAKFKIKE
jgi:hypothetical protein